MAIQPASSITTPVASNVPTANNAPHPPQEQHFSLSAQFTQSQAWTRGGRQDSTELVPLSQRTEVLSSATTVPADLQKENSVLQEALSVFKNALVEKDTLLAEKSEMIAIQKSIISSLEQARDEEKKKAAEAEKKAIAAEQRAGQFQSLYSEEAQKNNNLSQRIEKLDKAVMLLFDIVKTQDEKDAKTHVPLAHRVTDGVIGAVVTVVCVMVIGVAKKTLSN